MGLTDLPILSMLRTRMDWAQERQRVLAENVANSDTPNFRPHDLVAPKFDGPAQVFAGNLPGVALVRTNAEHIAGGGTGSPPKYAMRQTGANVNLEEEMMKVAANNMDYQAVTALYTRSINLFKIALGKK